MGNEQNRRILIIDDEQEIINLLRMRLTANGYSVISANNGQDGIDLAKKENPDLIILDFGLPDILGPQVAAILNKDPHTANIPIIFLSAMFSKEEEINSKELQSNQVMIAKPWDDQEMAKTIERLLGKQISNQTSTLHASRELKVMLVDDDVDLLRLLTLGLRKSGYDVVCASDGYSAIEMAIKERPDVIFLDICFPAGGGYEVLRRIQANTQTMLIPVIIMSGKDESVVKEDLMGMGAYSYIQKPIDLDDLLFMINQTTNFENVELSKK